jgi:hypothetical protein
MRRKLDDFLRISFLTQQIFSGVSIRDFLFRSSVLHDIIAVHDSSDYSEVFRSPNNNRMHET